MQHDRSRCPVTAIAFLQHDVVLSGEGNSLKAYNTEIGQQLIAIKVFESQAIHGIVVNEDDLQLVVWGGPWIGVLTISQDESFLEVALENVHSVHDWILDVAFAPDVEHSETQTATVVTAHNAIWLCRINTHLSHDPVNAATLELAIPGSNCILYTAHLKWLSQSHCLIASGTAFGDAIIWSAHFDQKKTPSSHIHFTFSAHEGSVFGVQISSPILLPQSTEEKTVLATCSDDRTIRLWDVSELSTESPSLTQLQRDTGFGSRAEIDAQAPPLLAKVMGHSSRIWRTRFPRDAQSAENRHPTLLSFGEDAFTTVWSIERSTNGSCHVLQQVRSQCAHAGKNIWSVSLSKSNDLVTGGADGAIAIYPSFYGRNMTTKPTCDLRPRIDADHQDGYKAYCFISTNALIATTILGRVMLIELLEGAPAITELSGPLAGLRGYSVVAGLPGFAFISGSDGKVLALSRASEESPEMKTYIIERRSGKTAALFTAELDTEHICLLATGVGNVAADLYVLSTKDRARTFREQDVLRRVELSLPRDFIVTSFDIQRQADCLYAFLGSRTGSVAAFTVQAEIVLNIPVISSMIEENVHDTEAVTAVQISGALQHEAAYLFSTGRDGTLAVHKIASSPTCAGQFPLHEIHKLSLPFGPNIEGLSLTATGEVLVWGFKSKHFILHNASLQQDIMSVECGGAHRNWAFDPMLQGGTFVWTKAGKVYRDSQTQRPFRLLNAGAHGREIKAVATSGRISDGTTSGTQIVATGAEDTDIKLWSLSDGTRGFRCLSTLRKHNTGIQHLAWDESYLFSSGGFEEFFVWRVTPKIPGVGVGVFCESTHPRSGKSDLRIMGFDVKRQRQGIVEIDIWMVYSNSTLKLWEFRPADGSWIMKREGDYLTHCLTHATRPFDGDALLTAATDGHLASWNFRRYDKKVVKWFYRHKVHQSAFHALACTQLDSRWILIASGGDDNAIGLTRAKDSSSAGDQFHTLLIPCAHAAAVTGLAIIPRGAHAQQLWLVSASIDQQVKLWSIDCDGGKEGVDGIEVKKVQEVFTPVADVSGLETCRLEDGGMGVVVCGVGMDVWRLPEVW